MNINMDNNIIEKRKMLFSQRLKKALEELNVTQTELCKRTDIPKSAMSQYVSGNFQPKQDRLYKIADSLNISPAWLMGYDVPMQPPAQSGFRIHKNLNKGYPYLAWQENELVADYVKKEQALENAEVIPCFNMDDVSFASLDLMICKPIDYRPLLHSEIPEGNYIYVIYNSKYDDFKGNMYPLIEDNDMLLLDFGAKPQNGDLTMIEFLPGKNFLCRYYKYDDLIEFQFLSRKSLSISVTDENYRRYDVRGIVKQIIRNVK